MIINFHSEIIPGLYLEFPQFLYFQKTRSGDAMIGIASLLIVINLISPHLCYENFPEPLNQLFILRLIILIASNCDYS
jgi:hypothetical protein